MRMITKDNYEEFFLDFLDGNLSEPDISALEEFLLLNPELKQELEEMELLNLEPCELDFKDKNCLKKSVFEWNFEEYCVARMEGDLTSKEAREFELFLNTHKELQGEAVLFDNIRLKPDNSIVCPGKAYLKKRSGVFYYKAFGPLLVAASLVLLFFLWVPEQRSVKENFAFKREKIDIPEHIPDYVVKVIDHGEKISQKLPTLSTEKASVGEKANAKKNSTNAKPEINTVASEIREIIAEVKAPDMVVAPVMMNNNSDGQLLAMNSGSDYQYQGEYVGDSHWQQSAIDESGLVWKESSFEKSKPQRKKVNLIHIAGKGIQKLGQLAGKKLKLEKKYDPQNECVRFAFNSSAIGFSTIRKK